MRPEPTDLGRREYSKSRKQELSDDRQHDDPGSDLIDAAQQTSHHRWPAARRSVTGRSAPSAPQNRDGLSQGRHALASLSTFWVGVAPTPDSTPTRRSHAPVTMNRNDA